MANFNHRLAACRLFLLCRLAKVGDQPGDGIAGIRADAPEQVDCLAALGRITIPQPLDQMRNSCPAVRTQAEQGVHCLVADALVVVPQLGQQQRQQLVAGQPGAVQSLEPVGHDPAGRLRLEPFGQALGWFARLAHPADGHRGGGADIFIFRAKRLQYLRVSRRPDLTQRGPGGFADVTLLIRQQGGEARHRLVSVRTEVAEHPDRSAANGLALVIQCVNELRHSRRANPGQRGDDSQPHLVAITPAAPAQSLDQFRRGLAGVRTEIGQRGSGPEKDLFLIVIKRIDQCRHCCLGLWAEQRQ